LTLVELHLKRVGLAPASFARCIYSDSVSRSHRQISSKEWTTKKDTCSFVFGSGASILISFPSWGGVLFYHFYSITGVLCLIFVFSFLAVNSDSRFVVDVRLTLL
jgi:hypothetical protein